MLKLSILLLLLANLNCSSDQTKTDDTSATVSTPTFPVKPLVILNKKDAGIGADIRLSYTQTMSNGRSTLYEVNSTFENKNIGFQLFVPPAGNARLTIKSIGSPSNNFVHLLAKLYKQKIDSTATFATIIRADCINMESYIDSLNDGSYKLAAQYKVFLKNKEDGDYAELFMDINQNEHWIEIGEKDIDHRPAIIRIFTKK